MSEEEGDGAALPIQSFEKVRTHFPSARIKKLMQSDEEIGKVAQATPIVVGRALELFLCSLVEKSLDVAKNYGSRKIAPQHLIQAVSQNEEFDFCESIVEKYKSNK
ncbi:unnamed protein product [Kuraishia capsulata CBS 1993]|uniref:Transcription factor CBF/NF-Y/archaeal histone domain-containing protein n=1 Tax=Kuraishia capsulata CBS 1993 TaxID=1382522 RepID=W6MF54_9ASCO|nr:uncharacterized protein KUCA_T00000254001 [Kuraishia capsulata CBS 1993]CDK24294.1 unnamed protein product [Kuraishia capsulata CBS 1993]